jgi:hypothetical protein
MGKAVFLSEEKGRGTPKRPAETCEDEGHLRLHTFNPFTSLKPTRGDFSRSWEPAHRVKCNIRSRSANSTVEARGLQATTTSSQSNHQFHVQTFAVSWSDGCAASSQPACWAKCLGQEAP